LVAAEIEGEIVDYGKRLDLPDIEAFIRACGGRDLDDNNRRAIASGHTLI
jgi:hypothetical protein